MDLHTLPGKLYDLTFLEEMDDNEYLLDMLTLLATETPKDLHTMKAAALTGDYDTVSQKAHVLKSTAGIIHVTTFVALMVEIEAGVKSEVDQTELVGLIDNAVQIFTHVDKGLRERMALLQ